MKTLQTKTSGFTLIELLVVISIIGLLSSIVLAALNSARAKAEIAAGNTFHNSLNGIAYDGILIVPMYEGAGLSTKDTSVNNATGILANGVVWDTTNTPNKSGHSLKFSGAIPGAPYIHVDTQIDASLVDKLTVSAWIYPTNLVTGYHGIAGTTTSGGFMMLTDGFALACRISTSNGLLTLYTPPGSLSQNKWQQVACIYDGAHVRAIINGREVVRGNLTGTISHIIPNGSTVGALIGLDHTPSNFIGFFSGNIADVKIIGAVPN